MFKLVESVGGCGRHEVSDDEVFVVELLKGPEGLGLSLVNGVVRTRLDRFKRNIFICLKFG